MTSLAAQLEAIELVGPKGYVHGWHFVGIPALGHKIHLPGLGAGTVVSGDGSHVHVKLASGRLIHIPHDKGHTTPAKLARAPAAVKAPPPKQPEAPHVTPGETLFHGTAGTFKLGDVISAGHSKGGVTRLQGANYAFASTDPGEASFFGESKAGRGQQHHLYRVEPVGKHEVDPHMHNNTSRRTTGGFRVVEEVTPWSGGKKTAARVATTAERKAYVKTGELPPGVSLASQLAAIELAAGMAWLHELRDENGKWTRTPGDKVGTGLDRYKVPAHERLINPRADHPDPADYPFFKKHPVSADNVIAAYDATPKGLRDAGMHWYHDAYLLSRALAHGNAEEGAILLANYSPQANWPINMFRAARVADEGKPIPAGEGYVNNDQVKKAQKALDGMHIDQVLISPKTRSFAHLLAQGDDSPDDPYGHVVIDAHALNVAAGGDIRGATYGTNTKRKKLPPEDQPPIATDVRAHEYVGDMYRQAAKYISERDGVLISPHQMQAITWVGQVMANQAEDRAVMEQEGSAKGRLSARAKDWKRWLAYAKGHHFALIPGVSALSAQLLAIELASDGSLLAQLLAGPVRTLDGVELAYDPKEPRIPAGHKGGGRWFHVPSVVYHSSPFSGQFPHDEWEHFGSRAAAEQRTHNINPSDFGLPGNSPSTIHAVKLSGRVYPHIISDEEANEIGAGGRRPLSDLAHDGQPSGEGYYIFPYRNEGEDVGSISYLAHRSAVSVLRTESVPTKWYGQTETGLATELATCPGCGCLSAQLLEPPPFHGLTAELAYNPLEKRDAHGRWTRGGAVKAFEFFGPHGSGAGVAFLPGNREPEVGDMARSDPAGHLVVGRVISKAGGHAAVDADDGNRYLVDWRNGGEVRHVTPLSEVGPALPAAPPLDSHARSLRARQHVHRRAVGDTWTVDEQGKIVHGAHPVMPRGAPPVGVFRDPHPDDPDTPWIVRMADGTEVHVTDEDAAKVRKLLPVVAGEQQQARTAELVLPDGARVVRAPSNRRRHGPWMIIEPNGNEAYITEKDKQRLFPQPKQPSPPGTEIAPGVKQYLLPGMPEPSREYGHNSAAVVELRKLEPQVDRALAPGYGPRVHFPTQGAQGSVAVVELDDGTKVVTKSQNAIRNDREELGYYVSQVVGAGAPPVVRSPSNPRDIIEGYVPGKTLIRYMQEQTEEGGDWAGYDPEEVASEIEYSAAGGTIGLLDYLTGNPDRHEANVMVDQNGNPTPIDHGMAFEEDWTSSPFWEGGSGEAPGGWSVDDVAAQRAELMKIEPEFARLGHLDWFQAMLDRVDLLQEGS